MRRFLEGSEDSSLGYRRFFPCSERQVPRSFVQRLSFRFFSEGSTSLAIREIALVVDPQILDSPFCFDGFGC